MKHVKKFEAIYNEDEESNIKSETESLKARIKKAAWFAQETFWANIVEDFSEIKTGDFPPDATFEFNAACEKAVKIWVEGNITED